MSDKFQINIRHQFKSIKAGLPALVFGLFGILVGLFSGLFGPNSIPILLIGFGLWYLLLFSPAIYLHIVYFITNGATVLTVDNEKYEVMIKTKNGEFKYKYEDIRKSELNLVNRTDSLTNTMPWTTYGYLKLGFKDEKEFIFTSLMLDLDKLPFPVKTTKFRFIPYLDKGGDS